MGSTQGLGVTASVFSSKTGKMDLIKCGLFPVLYKMQNRARKLRFVEGSDNGKLLQ